MPCNPVLKHFNQLLLLLLLSHFSRVRLCATPWMAAHQAPLSLGFSRQEHWSGLPFPSPRNACMLSRFSRVRLCATLWTAAHQAPLSVGFSRQEYWSVAISFSISISTTPQISSHLFAVHFYAPTLPIPCNHYSASCHHKFAFSGHFK